MTFKTLFCALVGLACVLAGGCVTSGGGGYSSQQNQDAFFNYLDAMERKQQIVNESRAQRDAVRRAGGTWTHADEQRRINEMNNALRQNSYDWLRQSSGR